jgi:exonuclease III
MLNPLVSFKNANFQMMKFYFNNKSNNVIKINKSTSLLSYNVHGFSNINNEINKETNLDNILKLIEKLSCDIVLLQEVTNIETVVHKMKTFGYVDSIYAPNGAPLTKKQDTFIVFFSKNKLQKKAAIELDVWKYKRNMLCVAYNNMNIAGVQLEIGERFHHYDKENEIRKVIEEKNQRLRYTQLKSLLNNDIILGDFNFTPTDPEAKTLRKTHNFGLADDMTPTNPFGTRTDMTFIKLDSKIVTTELHTIKCNFSDHLPIVTVIHKLSEQ